MSYALNRVCRIVDTLPVEDQGFLRYVDLKDIAGDINRIDSTDQWIRTEVTRVVERNRNNRSPRTVCQNTMGGVEFGGE